MNMQSGGGGDKNDCSDEDIFFSHLGAGTVRSFNIKAVSPKQPPVVRPAVIQLKGIPMSKSLESYPG